MRYVVMSTDKKRVVVHHEFLPCVLSGNFDCVDYGYILELKEKWYTSKILAHVMAFCYSGLCVVEYAEYLRIVLNYRN